MTHAWKVALLLTVVLLLVTSIALAQEPKGPTFSTKDRQLIDAYYSHLIGNLAPGSLDRSAFPLGIEKALVAGSHVPMQLEKDLVPLPAKLESQLSQITGDYGRYTLGRHIVLIKKGDLTIADVLKNAAAVVRGPLRAATRWPLPVSYRQQTGEQLSCRSSFAVRSRLHRRRI